MIAHLEIDSFFTAVERASDPSLGERPIIIGGPATGPGSVITASAEARQAGVVVGMRLRDAARVCPSAAFRAGSVDRYIEASAAIDALARSAGVAAEWTSVDEAYLDLRRVGSAGAARVVESILRRIAVDLKLTAAVGVASTKVVSRIASRLVRPSGLLYVLPGYEARFLDPLPIHRLLGDEDDAAAQSTAATFVATMRDRGCATIGDAARLAASHDDSGATSTASMIDLLHGRDDRAVLAQPAPRALEVGITLPGGARRGDALDRAMEDAVRRLAQRLSSEHLLAVAITISVRGETGRACARTLDVRRPTALADRLLPAARRVYRRAEARVDVVRSASISCAVTPGADAQLTLFEQAGARPPGRKTA